MKKLLILLLAMAVIGGCAGPLTPSKCRDKYGPPGRIEKVGNVEIWYYCNTYLTGVVQKSKQVYCYEYHFDDSGKLVKKREYWKSD